MASSVLVIDVTRNKISQKHVEERIGKGLCCACNSKQHLQRMKVNLPGWVKDEDIREYESCGNCKRCERRFENAAKKLSTKALRAEYYGLLVSLGLRLEPNEIREFTRPDVGSILANQLASKG